MVLINFYFIHAKWLADRERIINDFRKTIENFTFRTANINKIEIIEEGDPDNITSDFIKQHVNNSPLEGQNVFNHFLKNLHVHQLSNCIKHYKALERIAQTSGDSEINIVLEDDILYENRICLLLEKLVRSIPSDFDFIFLGLPTNKQVEDPQNINYQNTSEVFKVFPYCDSYVVSRKAAQTMYENFLPIKFITNIQFTYLFDKYNLKTQLAFPNLFMDGTKVGNFVSSLNPNNSLMFNNEYNAIKNLINKEGNSEDEDKQIIGTLTNSPIASHPDMCYLKAKYLEKKQRYGDAKNLYEETYQKYRSCKAIINHESIFLKDYIRLFKNLQEY